ncbi:cytochrome c oxidase assembly factor Coa1 family protein [Enterovibrio norvegicus]|uniref:cytochrome c oxidase assembly factor Coa1 family protein n=1 Tax=Enterovibrio norvegicus TaxID=188144 RepID=UPI0015E450B8|nr:cytochrome c oxidase assembly factor Coa1 family protein [Enterovibrio norvegicus]
MSDKQVPDEIRGWNWGALLLNIIWGIRFRCYRTLWVLFPFFGVFYLFVVGAKGNEWAWKNNEWESVEAFKASQKRWSRAALAYIGVLVLFSIVFTNFLTHEFDNSPSTEIALATLEKSESFKANIGVPYDYSLKHGKLGGTESEGFAEMEYAIEGFKGEGILFFKASHILQDWTLDCLTIQYTDTQETEAVIPCD